MAQQLQSDEQLMAGSQPGVAEDRIVAVAAAQNQISEWRRQREQVMRQLLVDAAACPASSSCRRTSQLVVGRWPGCILLRNCDESERL